MRKTGLPILLSVLFCFVGASSFASETDNSAAKNKIIVSNIKTGLMGDYSTTGKARVTESGNHFSYAANGTCKINNESQPCMWWGFTFEYSPITESTIINCSTTKLMTPAAKTGQLAISPYTLKYNSQIKLSPDRSHIALNLFAVEETGTVNITTQCQGDNLEPLTVSMTIDFPAAVAANLP